MNEPISLIVKASQQTYADFTIKCSDGWTVLEIKKYINTYYPGNPKEECQRLIYSGRLLKDEQQLKEFLRKDPESSSHIVHLVCSNIPRKPVVHVPKTSRREDVELSNPQSSMPTTTPPPPVMNTPHDFAQQMALYHQLYAQYLAQYSNFYSMVPTQITTTATVNPQVAAVPEPQQPVPQPENIANNNEQPPAENVRMNAAGPAAADDNDDELGGRRDWLDWLYVAIRSLMLLCILFFYSSFGRLMIVAGVSVLLYLYQNRWFATQPRQNAPEQPNEPDAQQNNQNNNDDQEQLDQDEPDAAEYEDQTQEATTQPQNPSVQNQPPFLSRVWIFFFNLFFSLIPEPPAAQN